MNRNENKLFRGRNRSERGSRDTWNHESHISNLTSNKLNLKKKKRKGKQKGEEKEEKNGKMEKRRGDEREGKRGSTFSLRSKELGWSSRIEPRLKVGILVEGNAWTPKSGVFVGDMIEEFGKSKISGLGNIHETS